MATLALPEIVVHPGGIDPPPVEGPLAQGGSPAAPSGGDGAWGALPDFTPPAPAAGAAPSGQSTSDGAFGALPDYATVVGQTESIKAHGPQFTRAESAGRGIADAVSLGGLPALSGLAEASGQPEHAETFKDAAIAPLKPLIGAYKLLDDWAHGHRDPTVMEAYNRGREKALSEQDAAKEQNYWSFLAGQIAGSLLVPLGGAPAATAGARVVRGAVQGAVGGGAYGGLTSVGQGNDPSTVAKDATKGVVIGGAAGGAIGGILGRRPVNPNSPGQRAAATAENLGAPLPRGLTSDNRAVQATTAKLRSIPFAGERIGHRVDATAGAAGEHLSDIASTMTGGAPGRAATDFNVRPGLQAVIDANKAAIDAAYNAVRSRLPTGHGGAQQTHPMPRMTTALDAIVATRRAAGHPNPEQGLEQFRNLSRGATFNGAHRGRVDAREAGNTLVPNPGYNAGDYNRLTRAMTEDLRQIVRSSSPADPARALREFEQAETQFGVLADQNKRLHGLLNSRGEGAIATLLGAARKKGGDLKLLAQLRASMTPQEFSHIGGALLHELGYTPATGEFSLAAFVTNLNKVEPHALDVLFSPSHARDIRDIAGMGQHIKGALRESNNSHTAGVLIFFEIAKEVVSLGTDIAMHGGVPITTGAGMAASAAVWQLTRWLGNPATAASMGAFARSLRGVSGAGVTAARIAAFNIATRNLAHNLNVPVENVMRSIQGRLPAAAQPADENKRPN